MNRNTVILDGQHKGGNGIEIYKDNDVWVENLTVRNFELTESCGDEECGNEIWWNGGSGSGKIGAHGWFGRYLTAYDTGMNGGYGIFTNDETEGSWEDIYSSGMDDSGMYLGACRECKARISKAMMEDDAVGYSGSNSGGNLIIEDSVFRDNRAGIVPNSENPGDPPPPSNGACNPAKPYEGHHKKLPTFESTDIQHCTIYRDNLVEDNNNLTAPTNSSTAMAPWGVGVEFPGVYGDAVEGNTIKGNVNDGFLGFEYPNPYPPEARHDLLRVLRREGGRQHVRRKRRHRWARTRGTSCSRAASSPPRPTTARSGTPPPTARSRRTSKANGAATTPPPRAPTAGKKRWDGSNSSPTNPRSSAGRSASRHRDRRKRCPTRAKGFPRTRSANRASGDADVPAALSGGGDVARRPAST